MSGTERPRNPIPAPQTSFEAPTLSVSGNLTVGHGTTTTLTSLNMNYYAGSSTSAPFTAANVLYTVTTPPAHGILLLDGAPTSQFTQQNINDGRVAYHNTGGSSDSYTVFAEVTEVPGVVKPYTPHCPIVFFNSMSPGTNQGAFYAGVTLIGATQMPNLDGIGGVPGLWGVAGPSPYYTFATTRPNEVVFACAYSQGSTTSLPYPSPVPLSTIVCGGLTFTRLGGGNFNTVAYDTVHGVYRYTTVTAELWYAIATASIPSTEPVATWATTGTFVGPETVYIQFNSWSDLADLSNPWGTDPASLQMFTTYTVPNSLSLNTSAPDHLVRPVVFEIHAGDYDGNYGTTNQSPKGFSFVGFGGQSGGDTGDSLALASSRTAINTGSVMIHLIGETLTDAELFFTPTPAFVDFTDATQRRKFVEASGTPQWIGVAGGIPFGGAPSVYLKAEHGNPDAFAVNNGVGSTFAITGELDEAGTAPACVTYYVTEASGPTGNPEWRLTVSDDGGRTWSTLVKPRSIGKQGEYLTRLRWMKLGHSRERMIRLECSDPVRRNIVGFYTDTGPGLG